MAWLVHVLRGSDGRLYTGMTKRLRLRIGEHNRGGTAADAGRGPFELVHKESHPDSKAARAREKFPKSGVGRAWLKTQIGI
jgi:putative endonuclease